MNYYLYALKHYSDFSSRASRKEYWTFALIHLAIVIGLDAVSNILDLDWLAVLVLIYAIVILVPGLAASFRRLHDIGKSAWWLLLSLVPIVGPIVILVFTLKDSEPGDNVYGPNPKIAAPPSL